MWPAHVYVANDPTNNTFEAAVQAALEVMGGCLNTSCSLKWEKE